MEKAIQQFCHLHLRGTEHIHSDRTPEFQYDLSPDILAMTHVFEELDQHTSMPEFGKALRELPAGVDIEVFAEFLFAQWRIVNHAHQVETQRFVQVGPRKPEPIATAQ